MKPCFIPPRRAWLKAVTVLLALGGAVHALDGSPAARPNVLFIAADDLNNWLGCLGGHPDVQTPNLDRLAASGMLFTNAHCAAPICNPSRTALFTGVRPSTSGVYHNVDKWADAPALRSAVPIPQWFRQQGYRTMTVGKVLHSRPATPTMAEMFDEVGTREGRNPFTPPAGEYPWKGIPHPHGPAFLWGVLEDDKQSDDVTARWAAERLRRTYDQPFFLAAGFNRPHVPLTAPKRFFDLYQRDKIRLPLVKEDDLDDLPLIAQQIAIANWQEPLGGSHFQIQESGSWRDIVHAYLASVSYMDYSVGRLLDALAAGPNARNTVVIFWSDNGWSLGEKYHWQKWSLWETETFCPLIVRVPGMTPPGSRCHQPVSLLDLYPTLIDVCGLPARGDQEGESLRPLLNDPESRRDTPAITSFGPGNHAIRSERWRYIRYADGSEELYDHAKDPREFDNLAKAPAFGTVKAGLMRWLPKVNVPALSEIGGLDEQIFEERGTWHLEGTPGPAIAGRSITITARIEAPAGATGVIYHQGNVNIGFALYIKNGRPAMAIRDVPRPLRWDNLKPSNTVVTAPRPLPEGPIEIEGRLAQDGTITVLAGGQVLATGKAAGTLSLDPNGHIAVGEFVASTPIFPEFSVPFGDYTPDDKFPGRIERVTVRYGVR